MTTETPDPEVELKNRISTLVDQSLGGLFYFAILGVTVLTYRLLLHETTLVVFVELLACSTLAVGLFYRRYIPTALLHRGIVCILILAPTLALTRYGLSAPPLIVLIVLPIIIGAVRGVRMALAFTIFIMTLIAAVGALYTFGGTQPSINPQHYMQQPENWLIYVAIYGGMVIWASTLTAMPAEYWIASVRELKKSEQANLREREVLAALQRQQSIVQLSGGVAHDFNNILAMIMVNLEIAQNLKNDKDKAEIVDEALRDALDSTEKGAELTKNLLAFAKEAVLEPKDVAINDVVSRSISWIARTIPENIEIELKLANDLPRVYIDEPSLSSAMLNLIINSRDAMPQGGKIAIETRSTVVRPNDENPSVANLDPGHYIELTVSDTGTGIASAEQQQIFEPFYSTKAPTESSGLGLAMVQGFMTQSGGTIYLSSQPGSGAIFKLLFPAHIQTSEQKAVYVPQQNLHPSGASLMIVEDEAAILKSLNTILTTSGYRVHTAANGDQAWEALQKNPDVDLVLCDVVMPGKLQGTDLARKIKDVNPHLPVVLMSGHPFKHKHELDFTAASQLLGKPIRQTDLIEAIEQALANIATLTNTPLQEVKTNA